MTILFSDAFDGSGSIVGHTPNVPFGGQVWSVDSGAGVNLVSGQAVGVGAYGTYIRYGAASTSYGLPGDFTLNFSVTTSSSLLSTANGETAFQIILESAAGDIVSFSVYKDYGVWNLVFDTSGASNTISPANSTAYSGTIELSGGVATCTFMGTTLSATVYGGTFDSLSNIRFMLVSTVVLNEVETSVVSPESANISITAPSATCVSWSAAHATYALTGPAATVSAHAFVTTYAASVLTAPTPTLRSTAHDATGENDFTYTAPSPTLTIRTGANAQATAPSPTLSASGTVTIWVKADMTAPVSTLAATGTVSGTAKVGLSAPSPNLVGYSGAVCSVTLTGSPTLTSTGTTGGVGSAQVTCPLFQLSAGATAQNRGSANLLSPSPRLGAQAQAWLVAPSATLTAVGSAVITATFEAYAVNLKHSDPNANDEITRYTNFPFTHVVRYQNSYYGANSTGLYLLEGTTDNGTPIPWAFETAITDFKSPNKKTLAAAYFSGRFGTSSTIQLKKGEKSPITHAFTTPRGTLAQNHRQVFGKDRAETRTRYFALAASGTSEFELDSIECDVHNTTRRI